MSAASVRAYATHVLRHLGAAARYEPARRGGDAVLGSSLWRSGGRLPTARSPHVVAEHARRAKQVKLAQNLFCCFNGKCLLCV